MVLLTVSCSEVGQRVVALLFMHDVGHHAAVVCKGSHTQSPDQLVL